LTYGGVVSVPWGRRDEPLRLLFSVWRASQRWEALFFMGGRVEDGVEAERQVLVVPNEAPRGPAAQVLLREEVQPGVQEGGIAWFGVLERCERVVAR
jgi:hypothetical protein